MPKTHYRLIYTSRRVTTDAAKGEEELRDIVRVASRNNGRDTLCGALVASRTRFAQVLEGPRDALEATFERICCDPRHEDPLVISFGPSGGKVFGNFRMVRMDVSEEDLAVEPEKADQAMIEMAKAAMKRLHMAESGGD